MTARAVPEARVRLERGPHRARSTVGRTRAGVPVKAGHRRAGRRFTSFLGGRQEAFLTGVGQFIGVDDAVFVGVHQAKPVLGETGHDREEFVKGHHAVAIGIHLFDGRRGRHGGGEDACGHENGYPLHVSCSLSSRVAEGVMAPVTVSSQETGARVIRVAVGRRIRRRAAQRAAGVGGRWRSRRDAGRSSRKRGPRR